MTINVGINGFGRIGRLALRAASDLIDMSDLKVKRIPGGSECQTPNATKAVNANVYCHNEGLSRLKNQISDKPAPRNGTG